MRETETENGNRGWVEADRNPVISLTINTIGTAYTDDISYFKH